MSQIPCAWKKCRRQFTPRNVAHKHCSRKCGVNAWASIPRAERIARRATKAERHPKAKYIYEAKEDVAPGMCPWGCELPLPPLCKTCCRRRDCLRAYHRNFQAGKRELERPPLREQPCKCGCGGSFKTRRKPGQHLYLPRHKPKRRKKRTTFSDVLAKYRSAA